MDILISGLNNYVGRRCANLMADGNFRLFAITRNRKLFEERMSEPINAKVVEIDLLKENVENGGGLPDIDASFYFAQVPTLDDFLDIGIELLSLRNFIRLINHLHCKRLVYVARHTDKQYLQPIIDLFKECKINYTVVLKNLVVGKDCLLYQIYGQVADRKVVYYSKRYGGGLLQPIGIHDLVRWLKAMLHVPNFSHKILEVGGGEAISSVDLYRLYRKLKTKLSVHRIVSLPDWLFMLFYGRRVREHTGAAEFWRVLRMEGKVDNSWRVHLPFNFSPLKDILMAE
ncbi:SDR family oxidoreductase [Sphingobacterium sp. FBM7-1]|uniref:SDR family oxidoreductase n=1 Tax=Sphingobacterium sp. FBM7-1 TaxID=2886688 RepID=UPI001D115D4C|nr:hypothetical protein [Sphingobacterium sp. FBM7-1]MCC2598604.1 hypothetical protein [Sphingobacterium sp. FBM7-1]